MPYRLAIIADVHGDVHAVTDALAQIDAMGCKGIVCAGNIATVSSLAVLQENRIGFGRSSVKGCRDLEDRAVRIASAVVLCCVVLASAHARAADAHKAPTRRSLALIAVTRGEGFTEKQGNTIQELILSALDDTGTFKVIGPSDIAAMLTLEARKESAGCTGDSECMTRIAGALGVDLVATADVGKLGSRTVISLKLIDVRTEMVLGRAQQTVDSDAALPEATHALAAKVAARISETNQAQAVAAAVSLTVPPASSASLATAATRSPEARPSMPLQRVLGWSSVGVGAAILAAGVGVGLLSHSQQADLHTTARLAASAESIQNGSNSEAVGADVSFAVGGLLAAGGVGLVVF